MLIGQNVRNAVMNSRFDHWQRGISFPFAAAARTADRWIFGVSGDGGTAATGTTTQLMNTNIAFADQPYALRTTNTTQGSSLGPASSHSFTHYIEGVQTFQGKTVTLSIWMSSTIPNKAVNIYAQQLFGSGGSPAVPIQGTSKMLVGSGVQRLDYTFLVPSTSGKTIGPNNALTIGIALQQGSTNATLFGLFPVAWQGTGDTDIYRVQLNEGVPADFQLMGRLPDIELMLCQRYFQKVHNCPAFVVTASTIAVIQQLPVKMRDGIQPSPLLVGGVQFNIQGAGINALTSLVVASNNSTNESMYLSLTFATGVPNGYGLVAAVPLNNGVSFALDSDF